MVTRCRFGAATAAIDNNECDAQRAETAAQAATLWHAATPVAPDHPYLVKKQVVAVETLREISAKQVRAILGYPLSCGQTPLVGRLLVVPVKQGDRLSTLEMIDGDGRKSALAGRGTKIGGYWATGVINEADTLVVGEGVATVLTAKLASGHTGVATLSSNNLVEVAKWLRKRYPGLRIILLADLVRATGAPDPHAVTAAHSVGAVGHP